MLARTALHILVGTLLEAEILLDEPINQGLHLLINLLIEITHHLLFEEGTEAIAVHQFAQSAQTDVFIEKAVAPCDQLLENLIDLVHVVFGVVAQILFEHTELLLNILHRDQIFTECCQALLGDLLVLPTQPVGNTER